MAAAAPSAASAAGSAASNDWCPCDSVCSLVSDTPTTDSCDSQCSQHASYPASIHSKICWSDPMDGSVKAHSKHILIAQGSDAARWPEEVTSVAGSYASALENALQAAKQSLPFKVRASLSDAQSLDALHADRPLGDLSSEDSDPAASLDLLVFPDAIRVHHVRKDELGAFVASLGEWATKQLEAAKTKPAAAEAPSADATDGEAAAAAAVSPDTVAASASSSSSSASASASAAAPVFPLPHSALSGTYFLICSHKLRDKRCGVSGPILVDEINRAVSLSYPSSQPPTAVHTVKISHIGGHKFAGNVIVYPPGVWYGKVLPCHVPHLILAHVPGFALVDNSTGESKVVTAADTNPEAEQAKLKPLVRGYVDATHTRR